MDRRLNVAEAVLAGGLLLVALYFGWHSFDYNMGTLRRPGPGAAPLVSSALLGILCILILLSELWRPAPLFRPDIRGFILSTAGIAAWALLARPAGLLPATFATVLLVSLADRPWKPLQDLVTFAILVMSGYLLFIWLLSTPIALIGPY